MKSTLITVAVLCLAVIGGAILYFGHHSNRAIDALLSPRTSYQDKQTTWKQLQDAGGLDQTIAALKAGMAKHPDNAAYPAELGVAYINKLRAVNAGGNSAILAMQADQSFDAALKLDPSNWEAQYYKAASLSHWPPEMNKGPEVIERLSSLIDQQEAMPPQPQFAQIYILLGEQYQKAGNPGQAMQTWKLGASQFPNDAELQKKI